MRACTNEPVGMEDRGERYPRSAERYGLWWLDITFWMKNVDPFVWLFMLWYNRPRRPRTSGAFQSGRAPRLNRLKTGKHG